MRRHALQGLRRSGSDLAKLNEFDAEGLDLGKDAEHRGLIFKQAGEYGLAAVLLGHHRGEGGQSSRSEPTPYPDRVQAWRHATIVLPDLVIRRRRNPAMGQADPAYFGDVGDCRLERSRSWRARWTAADRSPAPSLA